MGDLRERVLPFIKEHFLALLIALVGVVFLVAGFVSLFYESNAEEEIFFASKETDPVEDTKQEKPHKTIVVDVSGAVINPGVYSLDEGSRVQDAIMAAGGMSPNVDQQKVAQMLNLAAPLTDGAKLYIPVVGDQMVTSGNTSNKSSVGSQAIAGASTQMININAASNTELEALPGIGEVTAGKIIENRPYGSVEELREKKVLGEATFEKVKDLVSVF